MVEDLILVLPKSACPSGEPQTFGAAFPGVWHPGVPVSVAELGLSAAEARRLVADHGLPLVETRPQAKEARAERRVRAREADE